MRVPDRIACQAGILPSVIKRHISQLKDFHFLVRGVNASGLENNKGSTPNKRPKKERGPRVKDSESESGWKSVLLLDPTPSAQKVTPKAPAEDCSESPPVSVSGKMVMLSLYCGTPHRATPSPHQIP